MTYQETLNYLYNQTPVYQKIGAAAYKPGLENSLQLDQLLGHPHQKYRTIHVGGTNGKGSTSHLLAAILQESGYKVGLYTSPHLVDFRERIRVNGKKINQEFIVNFVDKYRADFEPINPSFFELTMEMAFLYFAEQKVDVAVIEVGLGGRLDSTNIISPDICVITNIGLEHTQYLGNTLPKIASEKAGIIKPNTPVVIGEIEDEDVRQVFINTASDKNAHIIFAETVMQNVQTEKTATGWVLDCNNFPRLTNQLGGLAQEKNAKTVLATIEELKKTGYKIPQTAVLSGFKHVVQLTGLMGRWQILQEKPRVICDTGHNAHGIRYIAQQLSSETYGNLHIVFGMVNDKDINTVLSILPQNAVYYFTKASVDRAMDENLLAQQAATHGLHGNTFKTVEKAILAAKKEADENDLIFIGGSTFIVADAIPLFT